MDENRAEPRMDRSRFGEILVVSPWLNIERTKEVPSVMLGGFTFQIRTRTNDSSKTGSGRSMGCSADSLSEKRPSNLPHSLGSDFGTYPAHSPDQKSSRILRYYTRDSSASSCVNLRHVCMGANSSIAALIWDRPNPRWKVVNNAVG